MLQTFKRRTYEILESTSDDDAAGRRVSLFIMALICLNVVSVILETVEPLSSRYMAFFEAFEVFSVGVFTTEYLLRIWSCTVDPKFGGSVSGRLNFAMSPLAIVDLVAIAPFYLRMIVPLDLRAIRALRLFRLFRLLKMYRYSESLRVFGDVLKSKKEDLLVTGFIVLLLLLMASSVMYIVENEAQPEVFESIPAAAWWAVVTLTTVGYGDVFPITPMGRLVGAVITVLGVGLIALPTAILGSGFVEALHKNPRERKICPHCGKDIEASPETSSNTR